MMMIDDGGGLRRQVVGRGRGWLLLLLLLLLPPPLPLFLLVQELVRVLVLVLVLETKISSSVAGVFYSPCQSVVAAITITMNIATIDGSPTAITGSHNVPFFM